MSPEDYKEAVMSDKILPGIGLFFVIIWVLVSVETIKLRFVDGTLPSANLVVALVWANAFVIGIMLALKGEINSNPTLTSK